MADAPKDPWGDVVEDQPPPAAKGSAAPDPWAGTVTPFAAMAPGSGTTDYGPVSDADIAAYRKAVAEGRVHNPPPKGPLEVEINANPPKPIQAGVMPGAGSQATGAPTRLPGVNPNADPYAMARADEQLAALQGVNPHATSKYFPAQGASSAPLAGSDPNQAPKRLGYLNPEDDSGVRTYRNEATGIDNAINAQRDFIARDPETGRLAVYNRTPQVNESTLTSVARLVAPALATGPVVSTAGALNAAERAAALAGAPIPEATRSATETLRQAGDAVRQTLDQNRAANMAQDLQAHQNLGVQPAPITFSQGPVAGVGQMISRIPIIGYPIKRSLDVALVGARDAMNRIVETMTPGGGSVETAGHTLQQGLDRFRNAGVEDIEPGILGELGVQPRAPGPYVGEVVPIAPQRLPQGTPPALPGAPISPNTHEILQPNGYRIPLQRGQGERPYVVVNDAGRTAAYENAPRGVPQMSPGAAQEIAQANQTRGQYAPFGDLAYTRRGVPVNAARPFDLTMAGRRGAEDMTDAEISSLVNAPASQTSFAARAEALYQKAWNNLPRLTDMAQRPNRSPVAARNTREALRGIERQIANQISGQNTISGGLAARIANPHAGNFTIPELRAIRTEVGRALSGFNPLTASLSKGQLSALYKALTQDMEVGIQTLSARAFNRSVPGMANQPNYVQPNAAVRSAQALRDFRVADRYYRAGMYHMDRFSSILGTDNPQKAVGILIRSLAENQKGNLGLVRTAMNALRPEERNQIGAMVLKNLGTPKASARGMVQEAGFSPATFFTNLQNIAPEARTLLWGPEYSSAINDLERVVGRLANQEALANTSRSGTDLINWMVFGTIDALGPGLAVSGHMAAGVAASAGAIAPATIFSILFSRPSYVRWATTYVRARELASVSPLGNSRVYAALNQLRHMAASDPDLGPVYRAVSQHGIGAEQGVGQQPNQEQGRHQNPGPPHP